MQHKYIHCNGILEAINFVSDVTIAQPLANVDLLV
jgi:hypothetical protein